MQRHTMRRQLTITIVAVLATALGGCDMIGEELAEQAAEQVTGAENIEVDEDGVGVESSEGSFSSDDEGNFSMETDEGTFESQAGQVPEDFPSSVPLPDATVANGTRMDSADGTAWTVNFQYDSGEPSEVFAAQVEALEDAGFTSDSEFNMGDGSGGMAGALFENDEYTVNVSVIGESNDFILGYQVFPVEADVQE